MHFGNAAGRRPGEKLEATEKNKHEAERFLKQRIGKITAARHGGPAFITPDQQRATVSELLDALERDYKLRDKWNVKTESNVKPLRSHFGAWRAVEVTSETISAYIEEQQREGYANASINRRTQLLGQAFKLAVRNKRLNAVPYIIHLSEVGNERQGFFEREDFDRVVTHLPERLRDFANFGFITGWRKSSIQKLRWAQVTDEVLYLRAADSKTKKPETVPLEGELRQIINRRRAAAVWQSKDGQGHFSEYVFHDEGRPIGDFRKAWATACRLAGVQGKLFHDLRRTASRNMVAAGVPPQVAMRITGHRTDSMFRRYAIVNEEQKREALAKTEGYLSAAANRKRVLMMKGNK